MSQEMDGKEACGGFSWEIRIASEDSFGVVELVAVKPFEDSIWPSEIKSQLFVWCF